MKPNQPPKLANQTKSSQRKKYLTNRALTM